MSDHTPDIEPILKDTGSLAGDYFNRLYARSVDPWEFETSAYEAAKYDATLRALRNRYEHALELGCSIGVLTRLLAPRCEKLLATEISETALIQAQTRCLELPQVTFQQCDLTEDFPDDSYDLILVSEVGYYFSLPDLEKLRAQIAASLTPGGNLLLVHFTGKTNYPLTAGAVHGSFLEWEGHAWTRLRTLRTEHYLLDLLERT